MHAWVVLSCSFAELEFSPAVIETLRLTVIDSTHIERLTGDTFAGDDLRAHFGQPSILALVIVGARRLGFARG